MINYEDANNFEINTELSASDSYYNLTNEKLVPIISAGLVAGLNEISKLKEENKLKINEDYICNVSIKLGTTMRFYFGEDRCWGKRSFFKFKIGPVYTTSMMLLKKMQKTDSGISRSHAFSNLFSDATAGLDRKYKGLGVAIWVPKAKSDPFIEC